MRQRTATWILLLTISFVLAISTPFAFAKEKSPQKETASKEKAAGEKDGKKDAVNDTKDVKKEPAASVNGTIIYMAELDSEMNRYERQMSMTGQAPDAAKLAEMKKKVLDSLISRELLRQESQKLGIKVDPAEVSAQMDTLKKRFPNETEFVSTLKKMNLTEDKLKEQFAQDMAIKKMIDEKVSDKVTITPEEIKAFYDGNPDLFKAPEMVRASHILIKVDQKATPEEKAKAKEKIVAVQGRIKKGEDFAAVAKEVSECPSSANGGDLDFFQRGQMVGPFEDAAFALKPGDVSDIVETQFGYHLIKVTDKKEAGVTPYDEIKSKIEQHLKQEKVNKELTAYVDQLKTQAKIEVFLR